MLAKYKGRVLPYEFLLSEVWGPEYVGEIDQLRLHISSLRAKLEEDPLNPKLIQDGWGIGYRLAID